MKKNNYGRLFLFCRWIVRLFIRRYEMDLTRVNQDKPVVYVSHHQNLIGPFYVYLSSPELIRVWMLHVFLDREACYKHYKNYTFTKRFGLNKTIAGIIAYLVSYFITCLMKSGRGLPVYRGTREILKTFQISVEALQKGENIVIFPDIDYQDSGSEVKEMYEGFLFIEKYYFRKTKEHVQFVPLYVSRNMKKIIAGEAILFSGKESFRKESKQVLKQIQNQLNQMAKDCGDIDS